MILYHTKLLCLVKVSNVMDKWILLVTRKQDNKSIKHNFHIWTRDVEAAISSTASASNRTWTLSEPGLHLIYELADKHDYQNQQLTIYNGTLLVKTAVPKLFCARPKSEFNEHLTTQAQHIEKMYFTCLGSKNFSNYSTAKLLCYQPWYSTDLLT